MGGIGASNAEHARAVRGRCVDNCTDASERHASENVAPDERIMPAAGEQTRSSAMSTPRPVLPNVAARAAT